MITKKYIFHVETNYIGSEMREKVEVEFEGDETEEEKQEIIDKCFQEWVWNNINAWYEEVED